MKEKPDPDLLGLLLRIFAETNVLWTPFRCTGDNRKAHAATWERRRAYRANGLPIHGGGRSSDRKSFSRLVASARNSGWLTSTGSTRLSAALTTAADDHLRALTGCFRADESWRIFKRIERLYVADWGCVLEVDVLNTDYDRIDQNRDLVTLELQAEPFLVRGWLMSASDSLQRVAYSILPAGREALAKRKPKPTGLPAYDGKTADAYDSLFREALAAREEWRPEKRGLLAIPLSAGHWPLRAGTYRAARWHREHPEACA